MANIAERLSEELSAVLKSFESLPIDSRRLNEVYGWNLPAISKNQIIGNINDLIEMASEISDEDAASISQAEDIKLKELIASLTSLRANSFPNYPSSPAAGLTSFIEVLAFVKQELESVFGLRKLPSNKFMPTPTIRRMRAQAERLDQIETEFGPIADKVKAINEASEAADLLPVTTAELKVAREKATAASDNIQQLSDEINTIKKNADEYLSLMREQYKTADELVRKSEQAFKLSTTAGLAGAFHEKAKQLNFTVLFSIIALGAALGVAIWTNYDRARVLKDLLVGVQTTDRFYAELAILAIGLGAPIWFAWLATKQINQRFRLAEDYAFKAAVARAYEGYRKEAQTVDPAFAEVLLKSAISRFDEHPLRFVEKENHGSPLSELRDSKLFSWIFGTGKTDTKSKDAKSETEM